MGYEVPDYLEVDHFDENKNNDKLENLQLLTPLENKVKSAIARSLEKERKDKNYISVERICSECGVKFYNDRQLESIRVRSDIRRDIKTSNVFCSRSCSGKFHSKSAEGRIYKSVEKRMEKIEDVRKLSVTGTTKKEMMIKTGLSRHSLNDLLEKINKKC